MFPMRRKSRGRDCKSTRKY
ncbi:hypothetical protein Gogos_002093 [Gossypium gossypioides]|uniref:Uncharacterized protein n=1 Tax=Gossypium gossypioides TaxID=34282 RepID=A0A7J9CQB9_GOSGO|nr:hypothetical protein [Gossypium gossypioides]